jgi:transposase-like protein
LTKEQVLAMAREAEKPAPRPCAKNIKSTTRTFPACGPNSLGIRLARRFSPEEKLRILEEGYQNGVYRVCAAYGVDSTNYSRWKKQFGFSKSRPRTGRPRRFTKEEMLAIVKEAERTSSKAVRKKI